MATFNPGGPGEEIPGAPARGPGPHGESGGGPAAQEIHDFTQTEGDPSQHANLEVRQGEVTYAINLKLSSYVFIPLIAMALIAGSMYFAYKMSESPYAGWVLLGVGIFSLIVLGAGLQFSLTLLRLEKNHDPNKPPIVNLRRRTPHNTTSKALGQNKVKKPRINSRRKHRRPRNR
jgi:hypothetical protein